MSGNRTSGLKAKETMIKKFGKDYYSRIGREGGQNGTTGGFASMDKARLREVSALGGRNSKPYSRINKKETLYARIYKAIFPNR